MSDDSSLIKGAERLEKGFEDFVGKIPTPGYKSETAKTDTSWHDKEVSNANDSFRKRGTTMKTTASNTSKPKVRKGRGKTAAGK
jgi:hypothetical protein